MLCVKRCVVENLGWVGGKKWGQKQDQIDGGR